MLAMNLKVKSRFVTLTLIRFTLTFLNDALKKSRFTFSWGLKTLLKVKSVLKLIK